MKKVILLFLILFSRSINAEVPQEIQGIWIPDIEKSIVLMEKNIPEINSDYMKKKYLPKLKRVITKNKYTHSTGKRELNANISLKEKQGSNFLMILSNDSIKNMEITFIPRDKGRYIMKSNNPMNHSESILWKKQ